LVAPPLGVVVGVLAPPLVVGVTVGVREAPPVFVGVPPPPPPVGVTVGVPPPPPPVGVVVGVPPPPPPVGVVVGVPLPPPPVGVVVGVPGVLVGVPVGDPVGDPLAVVGVTVLPDVLVGDPVGVPVGVCPVVGVGVAERTVVVGLGDAAGLSPASPGNVSAWISARLLNPSPSESRSSIGPNWCPEPAYAVP
jgi:hypothetical protein